ncbi:MAG: nucleotidyl transferase AbiEii/AbiGii toxin family protein [Bacteroidaceae bacterium]|jgi:predicted nucleotidyltransferase
MNSTYNISSEKLDNPLLKELLTRLTDFFQKIDTDYYVIGATARDLVLHNVYNIQPSRKTSDLDIAIAITDWGQFDAIVELLPREVNFSKDKSQLQRFLYKDLFKIDIVPFGSIANESGFIYWQSAGERRMSVVGFRQMAEFALTVRIDDGLPIKVASLPGVFVLKLSAWKDRHLENNKDAYDMALLIGNYYEIHIERIAYEHFDILEDDDFDDFIAGGKLMIRDVKEMLMDEKQALDYVKCIIAEEVEKEKESPLINQILETSKQLKYEQVLRLLQEILKELISTRPRVTKHGGDTKTAIE